MTIHVYNFRSAKSARKWQELCMIAYKRHAHISFDVEDNLLFFTGIIVVDEVEATDITKVLFCSMGIAFAVERLCQASVLQESWDSLCANKE